MDAGFVRERITALRLQKGISEYKLSYDLGHSRGYINNISSGKVLPSMVEFLAICEYFEITPAEFFEECNSNPKQLQEAETLMRQLDESDMALVLQLLTRLQKK